MRRKKGGRSFFPYATNCSVGDDAGEKIVAAMADLPSTGGVVDARGIEGAQTITATITVNKPVQILLGYAQYTTSVTRAFDFTRSGRESSLIGVNRGAASGSTVGTRITAADSSVSSLIRIEGTDASTVCNHILLRDLTIEGSDNSHSQLGILLNFAQLVDLERVQFFELGQAVDIDDVSVIHFDRCNFGRCGTGDTAATANIRAENRSDVGNPSENVWFDRCLWEGDTTGGNNLFWPWNDTALG